MELSELTAISPVDGRYRSKCEVLADYFSEFALIRYRVMVEVEYFIALCELPLPQLADVDASAFEGLRDLYRDFSEADALRVKEIEKTTNHDVKAVEYLVKEKMEQARYRRAQGVRALRAHVAGHTTRRFRRHCATRPTTSTIR